MDITKNINDPSSGYKINQFYNSSETEKFISWYEKIKPYLKNDDEYGALEEMINWQEEILPKFDLYSLIRNYFKNKIMNEKIIVANIRYSDEQDELRPLMLMNVKYVLRHGCTKKAYYELDYEKLDADGRKYNYAPLGKEVPDDFFESKSVEYIDSPYYLKAKLNKDI